MESSLRISRQDGLYPPMLWRRHGLAEAVSKMAFGNQHGREDRAQCGSQETSLHAGWGDIVCEVPDGKVGRAFHQPIRVIGEVTDRAAFEYGSVSIPLTEALDTWNAPLERRIPHRVRRKAGGSEAGSI